MVLQLVAESSTERGIKSMGDCFCNCMVSGLPIDGLNSWDRKTSRKQGVLFFLTTHDRIEGHFTHPCDQWHFASLPLFYDADDYMFSTYFEGKLDEVPKETSSQLAWRILRPDLGMNPKPPHNGGGPKRTEDDWHRGLEWDESGLIETNFSGAGYTCRKLAQTVIRRDVWDWCIKNSGVSGKYLAEFRETLSNPESHRDYDWLYSELIFWFRYQTKRKGFTAQEYEQALDLACETFKFYETLDFLGRPIIPMVGLCPQERYQNEHFCKLQTGFNAFVGKQLAKDISAHKKDSE
jgi:hypothetical protein